MTKKKTATARKFFLAIFKIVAIFIGVYVGLVLLFLFFAEFFPFVSSIWSWLDAYDPKPTVQPTLKSSAALFHIAIAGLLSLVSISK